MRRYTSKQSHTFRTKRRIRTIILASVSGVALIASVAFVSWISKLSFWTITNVQVSGIEQEKAPAIREATLVAVNGSYLGLFSRANAFVYPRRSLERTLMQSYTEAQRVSIHRSGLHTLIIDIEERKPAALICTTLPDFNGNELSLDDPGSCYFADENGLIFKKAPSFSGAVYHRYYIPGLAEKAEASSTQGIVAEMATTTDEFRLVQGVYDTLQRNTLVTDALLMKDNGEYEAYVRNPGASSSTVVVYFNTITSPATQISNLISFWKHSVDTARTLKKVPEFESIDVRYGANVFYRSVK